MPFFGLRHSVCIILYIWDTWVPCTLSEAFYEVQNIAMFHISLFLRCLYFHVLDILRCLYFNILVASKGFLGLLHCIWIMLIYLKRWEPSYVFFNHYWAAMNPAKGQIWLVLAFCLNNEKTLHRCISMKFGSNTYTLFFN